VSAAAMAAGNVAAYATAGKAVENALAAYAELGTGVDASIPALLLPACIICEYAALLLIAGLSLRRLGSRPPLALLNAGTRRSARTSTIL